MSRLVDDDDGGGIGGGGGADGACPLLLRSFGGECSAVWLPYLFDTDARVTLGSASPFVEVIEHFDQLMGD